eukprot:gene27924-2530_t
MSDTGCSKYVPTGACDCQTMADMVASGLSEDSTMLLCSLVDSAIVDGTAGLTDGLNCLYLVTCAALVFIMHGGFAMLCAGAIRSKNTMNILLMTILDAAVSAICFYLVGSVPTLLLDGEQPNGFIGNQMFALSNFVNYNANPGHWQDWVFQWAFAATATAIPAGCVAERFNFNAYLGYTVFISAWVYPVVVHWVWSSWGWLGYWKSAQAAGGHLFRSGMIDYAGSGVVHMVGGFAGLCGCILVGPRMGRFDSNGKPVDMPGHSATLVVLGTVLLWFGWYGFNCGSMLLISEVDYAQVVGRSAVTTTLAGGMGGITALVLSFFRRKSWDLVQVCNGVLCGFVSITAGAAVLEPWAALIAGAVGACLFNGVCTLFLRFRIDDPLFACPMHGFCGIWGCLVVGLLAKQSYVYQVYQGTHVTNGSDDDPTNDIDSIDNYTPTGTHVTNGSDDDPTNDIDSIDNYPYGLFYPGGGGRLLASQVVGVLVIIGWVCGNMVPLFYTLKWFGVLRISPEEEQAGLDISKHGGSAYNHITGAPMGLSGKVDKGHHL